MVGTVLRLILDLRLTAGEFAEAEATWALHHRPFVEIEGWASSLVVLGIFATGFLRRKRESPTA